MISIQAVQRVKKRTDVITDAIILKFSVSIFGLQSIIEQNMNENDEARI